VGVIGKRSYGKAKITVFRYQAGGIRPPTYRSQTALPLYTNGTAYTNLTDK
jgi:hypothetical protein